MENTDNTENTEKMKKMEKGNRVCRAGILTKTWALIGIAAFSLVAALCVLLAAYLWDREYYDKTPYQILSEEFSYEVPVDADFLIDSIVSGNTTQAQRYCQGSNIAYAGVRKVYGMTYLWEYGLSTVMQSGNYVYHYEGSVNNIPYVCNIALKDDLPEQDRYRAALDRCSFLYRIRFLIFPVAMVSLLICLFLFLFLMRYAGYEKGSDEPAPWFTSRIPYEIILLLPAGGICLLISVLESVDYNPEGILIALTLLVMLTVGGILWLMGTAVRIRTGHLWNGSLLGYLFCGCRKVFGLIRKAISALLEKIPLIWKVLLGLFGTAVCLGLAMEMVNSYGWRGSAAGWGLFWLTLAVAFGAALYAVIWYHTLAQQTARLAAGELPGRIESRYLLPVFRRHARDLETIAGGIRISDEKRLASERTQAALITNVSHDIKTPLTSIINYADLIEKEECENEKIREYAQVLGRQSTRLKHLLEDLIEVSKAQSGAIEVHPEPCEVSTLVGQAVGEYEDKLKGSGLELVVKGADLPCRILADPARMWRVFDNLLGNICKYAQSGTRVYFTAEEGSGHCRITLKNTSAKELDLSPEELMERFVRGDRSREGAEGNGLGLSIAANLVRLQGGTLDLSIDGDLFKVTLDFPVLSE
ncbi:MAG: HAMP domain-containing histidine kinase [Lachnospiraceae bacterium]|nr:HAMP domain-containing histidine kinase [Lachnospiraceae bacterium]